MRQPWFHEAAGPSLFNEWTVAHILWGMVSAQRMGLWAALGLHTLYEAVEGRLFPVPHRDVSGLNHAGDTLAFLAGRWVARP